MNNYRIATGKVSKQNPFHLAYRLNLQQCDKQPGLLQVAGKGGGITCRE